MTTRLQLIVGFLLIATIAISQPTITSFTPASGPVGTSVTITGTNFSTTAANNIVFFGATRATVTAATAAQLTVTVPVGATYAPITVLNAATALLAYAKSNFTPTFSPNKGSITSADFSAKVDFTTGGEPLSVVMGDLDGDGKADLVLVNSNGSTVSVFRNTSSSGTVSYATKVDFTTGLNPYSVAIGDLDGDGKADLAVANLNSNTVSVFRNTSSSGTISYATKVDFATGTTPIAVAIGDLDGDGKADLAVANRSSNTVSVFRNTSSSGSITSSSFAAKVDFTTGISPIYVAIGDLDGDGKADLATANVDVNTISIFRNTGSSGTISYAAKVDFVTGEGPSSVSIGDLDGDGKADLVTANQTSSTISVFRNTGSSGTISYATKVDLVTGSVPRSTVAIGDLDGDGKADLATANQNSNTVSVFRNTGSSGTISYATKVDLTTGTAPYNAAIGDLDGDGKADIAVTNVSSNTVSVIRNNIKLDQTITFGVLPLKTFGDVPFTISATASSALPVTYISSNTPVATVSGNTVTIVGGGTTTITASQAGNANYNSATSVPQTLTVNKANQTITFASLTDKTVGDPAFTLSATSSSGLAIAYSSTSDKISIVNNQVTIASAGRAIITASQVGNGGYNPATPIDRSFCIKPAKPTVTLSNGNTPSPTLTSSASVGNQWYRNGVVLSGATTTTLAITQAGIYKVQAQVDDCISVFSDDAPLIVTATEPKLVDQIQLYPNPAGEELVLNLSGFELKKSVTISIVDLMGRQMKGITAVGGEEVRIDIREITSGQYVAVMQQGANRVAKLFVKKF
jgi:6-phosphogluconolactonase (cycloisomerase 2 family)